MSESSLHGPYPVLSQLLPPKSLHPNARAHWRVKAKDKTTYCLDATFLVKQYVRKNFGRPPMFKEVVIALTYVFEKKPHSKKHDPDNLISWAKTPIDCLTAGGLLEDDRDVIYLPPKQVLKVGVQSALEFVFWEGRLSYPPFAGG